MRALIAIILLIVRTGVAGQSELPPCQEGGTKVNCSGEWQARSGRVYVGNFSEGGFVGRSADGFEIEAQIIEGNLHGKGRDTSPDGAQYVGEYRDGKRRGQGTYTKADGYKYVGEWVDDKPQGQGAATFPDGAQYVGEYRDGKRHGIGTYIYADGRKHAGEWLDNKRHGHGIFYTAYGSVVSTGKWFEDKQVESASVDKTRFPFSPEQATRDRAEEERRTEEKARHVDKERKRQASLVQDVGSKLPFCKGFIKDGCRGSFECISGNNQPLGGCLNDFSKYEGEWQNNNFHGKGILTFKNGDRFVGEFRNGRREGRGIFTLSTGEKYIGNWRDGKYHGKGVLYSSSRIVHKSGRWHYGNLAESYVLDTDLFPFDEFAAMAAFEKEGNDLQNFIRKYRSRSKSVLEQVMNYSTTSREEGGGAYFG